MAVNKLLVAFDESEGADRALAMAASLAAVNPEAHVDVVYVVPIPLLDETQMANFKDILDMMISDVIMPGLDGPSLLKKARQYLGDAPVMFISGYAESDFSDLLQDEVGVSFLPKPLDIKTLAERVKQELHRETDEAGVTA